MSKIDSTMLGGATRITPVTRESLPAWREANPAHRDWLDRVGFCADPGSFTLLPIAPGEDPRLLAAPLEGETVWAFANLPTTLPEGRYVFDFGSTVPAAATVRDWMLGCALAGYRFTRYRAPKREAATILWPEAVEKGEVEQLTQAVQLARDLINTPADDMGPQELEDAVRHVAATHGASVRSFAGAELLDNNFPAIHMVGRASNRAPRLIDLTWGNAGDPKVTLVGKGVCFDTGGLDIKGHDPMLEMKKDMGGAAVMLGLAGALMAAHTPIRLRLLVPAVDNAIAGNAMRPRDIVRMRGGKSVEIRNTDAEGRLILGDALAEADAEAPDLLIDCATLTGAAKVALGTEVQALFCDDDEAADALVRLSRNVGDPLWRLPIWRGYRPQIAGSISDLANIAKGNFGGAIIAALFLAEFVSRAGLWMHVDIYAANASSRPGRPEGGEATGLRALYAFIRKRYG